MIALLLACNGSGAGSGGSTDAALIADYDGLDGENTWVYRDDGDTGIPDEDRLLATRHTGDGVVELRRGVRWADAETVGTLVWAMSDGLGLASWSVFGSGSGDYPLSDFDPEAGEVSSQGDWSCEASRPAEGESTWYGTFEDVFVFDCEGGGLEGRYVFARDVGLIRLTLPDGGGLNLVAPW
ncbi:MAG: hypothetical protein ACI8RZ_003790 [Myxococcota bacterium]